jgi:hypothetical protein
MRVNIALLFALCLSIGGPGAAQETNYTHRLFDFTPVSTNNPVVARISHSIEIPVSEYLTYQKADHESTVKSKLDLAQKKEILNDLIDEYLLVDEACRIGADKHPGFTSRMKFTRTMLLSDFLIAQEVDAKSKTAEEYNNLLDKLQKRLFDAATINVSIEDYDKLKLAAKEIDAADKPSSQSNSGADAQKTASSAKEKIREIMENMPDSVLARYSDTTMTNNMPVTNDTAITVKEVLAVYSNLHAPRPPLETDDDLVSIIKPFIMPPLMADEAIKQGIEALPAFQNKVIENQNALLRIYMHGVIEAQANKELNAPGLDKRIKAWYRQNAAQYAVQAADGVKTIPPCEEIHKRVEGDYSVDVRDRIQADEVRVLRKTHHIEINDAILNGL